MSLGLLDFTSGNVDLGVTLPGAGSSTSYKCVLGDLLFRLSRTFQDRRTLCSGPWRQRVPMDKGAVLSATKYASKGSVLSDPMVLQSSTDPLATTFTADTLNTITGSAHFGEEGLGGVAGSSLFGGPISAESYGAWSSTWVTT